MGPRKSHMGQGTTQGVKTLLGDPKKAIVKLAIPMIVAMSVQTIYNLVDAIWVSMIGADALAAVGLFFPFFFMAMAISLGIGIGGSSAISRMIGRQNKKGTDQVAIHTIILMLISALVFTFPLLYFARPLFVSLGAGRTIEMTVAYSQVMFGGTIIVFFSNVALALLRGEGDAKRPMYAMIAGSILNIVIDPLFIFPIIGPLPGLGLGVSGAAWATILSLGVSSIILFYWLFLAKNTYMSFAFGGFRFKRSILVDIFKVGVPASIQYVSMSMMMALMNVMIIWIGGTNGVAVFATGWRVTMIAILPILGLSTAVVAVTGATFGMKDYDKMEIGLNYAIKVGTMVEMLLAFLIFLLAPRIAGIFTTGKDGDLIYDELRIFLSFTCLFIPIIPMGMLSGGMFQGTGKGDYALFVTLIRTLILVVPFVYVIGVFYFKSLIGIWLGLILANTLGASIGHMAGRNYILGLKRKKRANARLEGSGQ